MSSEWSRARVDIAYRIAFDRVYWPDSAESMSSRFDGGAMAPLSKPEHRGFWKILRGSLPGALDDPDFATPRVARASRSAIPRLPGIPDRPVHNARCVEMRGDSMRRSSAPALRPTVWYGMPGYAKDGRTVCFFRADKEYMTLHRQGSFKYSYAPSLECPRALSSSIWFDCIRRRYGRDFLEHAH